MADPDYDMGSEEIDKQAEELGVTASKLRGGVSRDAGDLHFVRLPETRTEVDEIERVVMNRYHLSVKNYQDKRAVREVLYGSQSPRFLHLSTHGYFLKDEEVKQRFISIVGPMGKERTEDLGIENPMLRSGIALAGANTSLRKNSNEGLVSAEEILGLKLKGTELVVLSACETGVGDVQSGEGVFGLKRSFILSGAKTVVMSLWKIPSKETEELMRDFYTLMAGGKSKAEALREARLAIKQKHPSPFYWGALVMVGNPK
jgi:CHAT domain-containing protein